MQAWNSLKNLVAAGDFRINVNVNGQVGSFSIIYMYNEPHNCHMELNAVCLCIKIVS